ncbi:uncharacterized protein LOC124402812 isoform X2 [Silurus meridionalis]|uniref:uncharacterized protein LOC124402812 isoform X2 n=1 Tax=Silurus meridionalis TaxID=175797 RepID=UPI001EE9DC4E|nr:uncharacterized protein LOC124402812 isoform X2 [Silurus meridionalis]
MQMEQASNNEKKTLDAKDAQSTVFCNIVAQGGTVFAPIIHNVQGASGIYLTQNVGANISEAGAKDTASVITDYKESVLSTYAYTREYTSCPGEHVLLADRYVDPLIIQSTRVKKQREKEMRTKGNKLFNLNTYDANQSISIDNLFREEDGPAKKCPKAVILQGNSGNGKSFIAQKIILDWAEGDLFAGIFDVVFHLRCSELNGISGDIRLVELLNCSEEMNQIFKDKDKRILFLIDGFDELRCSLPKKALPVRVDIQAKPEAILSSLLMGIMLRESFLLVTTRSTSTEKLSKLLKCPHSFREIMGFSKKGVQEYFQKFFEDKELSTQVHEQVKTHDVLYTACFSPVMCWLICNVFKQKADMGARMKQLKSTTSIFIDFVFILLEHHCQDLNQSQKFILLKNLGQLAEEGMQKGKILFERHFVPELILNLVGIPFLCTFQYKAGAHIKEMFSFLHLCFQEFFAGLFYILLDNKECKIKIKQLLSSVSDGFHYSHLLPVIRFLFGFCNKNVTNLINEKHQHTVSQEISSSLEEWIQTFVRQRKSRPYSSFIIHCLYEVKDQNLVRNVMKCWETNEDGINIFLSSSQMTEYHAAAYCLQFCRNIRYLSLHASSVHILNMLEETLSKCSTLELTVNSMSDDDVDYLISAMRKGRKLKYLRIEDSSLSDHSIQMIMRTLNKRRSVTDIYLTVKAINHINTEILMNFCKSLKDEQHFRMKLATSENNEESLCLCYAVECYGNDFCSRYQITIGHHDVHSSLKSGLGLVNISVGVDSLTYHNDIKNILWISYNLREFESPVFEENVAALLSVLHSIPGLKQVNLSAENLSMKSAAKILSFSQERPKFEPDFFRCDVEHLKCIDDENVCSLSLSTQNRDYWDCVVLNLNLMNYRSSLQDAHMKESKPILPDFSLRFSFMEGATVNWEGLFETCSELMTSKQRTSFFLDKQMDTLLSLLQSVPFLNDLYIHLESLPEKWAVGVIYFLQACSSLGIFQLSMGSEGETLGIIKGTDSSWSSEKTYMTFGCSHLGYNYHGLTSTNCDKHSVLPCIMLTMRNNTKFCTDSWDTFFHHYNQLKTMTKLCLEYDQSLDVVLSHINTIPALEKVEMALQFLTVHGASSILHLILTSSSLYKIDVVLAMWDMTDFENDSQDWMSFQGESDGDSNCSDLSGSNTATEFSVQGESDGDSNCSDSSGSNRATEFSFETENYELDLCSKLRIRKTIENKFKLSLRCNSSDPDTKAVFAYISLTLSKTSNETEIIWRNFFQSFYETKGLTKRDNTYFDEKLNALLSFLHNLPGLENVEFGTHSLNESWVSWIFSLSHKNPNIFSICLLLEQNEQDDNNACSSLTIKRNFTDAMITVKVDLLQNTIPSLIHLKLPCAEICNIDGAGLLYRLRHLRNLNDTSPEYDMQMSELISFLHSVPQLQKVKLRIENLTTAWVKRILSLKTCHSLTKILVTTSLSNILVEKAISELEYKWTRHDCVVVIRGWRCNNPIATCSHRNFHQECNKEVNLSFCGGHCSIVPIQDIYCEKAEKRFKSYSDVYADTED